MGSKNVAPGDDSTEGLPRRINKADRHAEQAAAAKAEEQTGFYAGDTTGRRAGAGEEGYRNNR